MCGSLTASPLPLLVPNVMPPRNTIRWQRVLNEQAFYANALRLIRERNRRLAKVVYRYNKHAGYRAVRYHVDHHCLSPKKVHASLPGNPHICYTGNRPPRFRNRRF